MTGSTTGATMHPKTADASDNKLPNCGRARARTLQKRGKFVGAFSLVLALLAFCSANSIYQGEKHE